MPFWHEDVGFLVVTHEVDCKEAAYSRIAQRSDSVIGASDASFVAHRPCPTCGRVQGDWLHGEKLKAGRDWSPVVAVLGGRLEAEGEVARTVPWGPEAAVAERTAASAASCIAVALFAAIAVKDSTAAMIDDSKSLIAFAVSACFVSCFLSKVSISSRMDSMEVSM